MERGFKEKSNAQHVCRLSKSRKNSSMIYPFHFSQVDSRTLCWTKQFKEILIARIAKEVWLQSPFVMFAVITSAFVVIRLIIILGDPGADSGDEGKSKRAEKYDTKKSKERREELFSPFFTFLRYIYIFPPV